MIFSIVAVQGEHVVICNHCSTWLGTKCLFYSSNSHLARPVESHSRARWNILAGPPNIFTGLLWGENFWIFFQNDTFWRTSYFWPMVRPAKWLLCRVKGHMLLSVSGLCLSTLRTFHILLYFPPFNLKLENVSFALDRW